MSFISNLISGVNDWLVAQLGELGPLIAVGGLGVLLCLVALPSLLKKQKDPFKKISTSGSSDGESGDKGLRVSGRNEKLDRFSAYLEPQTEEELTATQLKMIKAGYRSKGAIQMFNFAKLALGIGGLLMGTLFVLISGGGGSAQNSVLFVLVPGFLGYYAPQYWITKRMQTREEQINAGFPEAPDLMLVRGEAGQTLHQPRINEAH